MLIHYDGKKINLYTFTVWERKTFLSIPLHSVRVNFPDEWLQLISLLTQTEKEISYVSVNGKVTCSHSQSVCTRNLLDLKESGGISFLIFVLLPSISLFLSWSKWKMKRNTLYFKTNQNSLWILLNSKLPGLILILKQDLLVNHLRIQHFDP